MTAPTSPGVVPTDDVRELAHRIVLHCQHTAVPEATEIVGKLLMADRANRPSLTEDERRLAEVEERAREDERDRLYASLVAVAKLDYAAKWVPGAIECFRNEWRAMLPADRAALRAKPEAQVIGGKEAASSRDAPPEGYVVMYGIHRSWHAYHHGKAISRWAYKADAIKACWDHAALAEAQAIVGKEAGE